MNVEHGSKVFCENSENQIRKCALLHVKLMKLSHFVDTHCSLLEEPVVVYSSQSVISEPKCIEMHSAQSRKIEA